MRKIVVVLGIPIDNLTMSEAIERLDAFVQSGRQTGKAHQVATINADFAVKSLDDPELRLLLREADMATADGMPLVWGARLLGIDIPERVAGADIVPALAERAAEKGYSIYFFGARDGIAEQAAAILKARHPGLKIAGIASPPFGSILEMDPKYIEDIKRTQPDIVLVALGNPKQEKWIGMYGREIGAPVAIGVGGTLDFIAGQTRRAPDWMQKSGLEWIYRLIQEPGRLWKRYIHDFFGFSAFFIRQWWLMRQGTSPTPILPRSDLTILDRQGFLTLSGRIDRTKYEEIVTLGFEALQEVEIVSLDFSEVTFIDSSAIGALVLIAKHAREKGGDIRLKRVPNRILQTLRLLKLDTFFEISDIEGNIIDEPVPLLSSNGSAKVVAMPVRFDAATAQETRELIKCRLESENDVILDFGQTRFLASAGLAALAEFHRIAEQNDKRVRLTNCSPDILRVLQLVNFDALFEIIDSKAPASTLTTSREHQR